MAGNAVRTIRVILTGDSGAYVKSMEVAGAATETVQSKMERMQKVGRGMSSLGRQMTTMALPVVALGAYAVKTSMSYQQALTRIATQTGATADEAKKRGADIMKLAGQVGFDPTTLAQGLYPIESEGMRGRNALLALTAAARGAKIGGDDLVQVADVLSGAMGTGAKDIHSASEAMVVLERTAGLGKMQLSDLTNAMKTGVISEGTKMGLGFRDISAALASMTKQGVPAEIEASRMKLTLSKMAAPAGAALKALQSIHLGQFTLANDLRKPHGLIVALSDLRAHLVGLSANAQNAVLSAAFGQSRGLANIAGLLHALPQNTAIRNQLDNATSANFMKRWAEQNKTPAQKFSEMLAKVKVAITQLGNALMPLVLHWLPKLTGVVTSVVKWFSHLPKPVRDVVAGFTIFLAIGGPILMFFGGLITAIGSIATGFKALTAAEIGAGTAMKATVIGLMVVALVLLITHFKQVKQIAGEVLTGLGIMARAAGHAIGSVFSTLFHIISWPFVKAWDIIKTIAAHIVSAFKGVAHTVGNVLHFIGHNPITDAIGLSGSGGLLHGFGLLHAGGVVRERTHFDTGGPVGTDTIPGWLTPGEGVLNRAAMANVGVMGLQRLNSGGSLGGDITITPSDAVVKLNDREIGQAAIRWFATRQARGSSSLVGGGMMTGSRTG